MPTALATGRRNADTPFFTANSALPKSDPVPIQVATSVPVTSGEAS